ncbi:MAG: hypothetical protein HKL89_06950 [Candidatus Dormibacteraeota bacterium]|nr:hypothetical protein [Candidatus Dormibacteraeota bacterium]
MDPGSGIASDAAALSPRARLTQATFPLVQFQTGSDVQFEVVTEPVAGLGAAGRPATGPGGRSGLEQPPRRHQRFGQTPSPAFAGRGAVDRSALAIPRIRGEIVIDRPLGEVFDFVAHERNESLYNPR